MIASAASGRMEFRLRPELKQRVEYAAALVHETTSDFARTAVEERAASVLREHALATAVPPGFFDALLAALDEPAHPNRALADAATRVDDVVVRR